MNEQHISFLNVFPFKVLSLGTYCNVHSDHTRVSSDILLSHKYRSVEDSARDLQFYFNHGASLNLLPFNATFTFEKGKKSYGTEFGE
jgi:hypothetical protein